MKKAIAAALLVCLLLSLSAPAALAAGTGAASVGTTDIVQAAGDILDALGEKIRTGGADLWSAFTEYLNEHSASEIVDHLKILFQETRNLTDDQLRQELSALAEQLGISLSKTQTDMIVNLIRRLEGMDLETLRRQAEEWKNKIPDWDDVEKTLDKLEEIGQKAQDTAKEVRGFVGHVKEFFRQAQELFKSIFG